MYIMYSIARNKGVSTCISTHAKNGKTISLDGQTSTTEAKEAIERIKNNNNFMVIELPIDGDSDYYDKYIVLEK